MRKRGGKGQGRGRRDICLRETKYCLWMERRQTDVAHKKMAVYRGKRRKSLLG